VCRGRLSAADADDAFQATFLVLTRQAPRIRKPKSLAGWLAGVAGRAAKRVQRQQHRRSSAERRLPSRPICTEVLAPLDQEERAQILNEEMFRLPENYYLPLLLCYFQGLTNEEAARRLGVPHGTVCGRLSRARDLLRRRLTRRGVTLTAGLLTVGVAGPPGELVAATLAATAKTGAGTAPVISIAEAVMNAMWTEKVRVWAFGLVTVAAIGSGMGSWALTPASGVAQQASATQPSATDPPAKAPAAAPKINAIEEAGKAIANDKIEEARKLLRNAVAQRADLPPDWLMLIRLYKVSHPQLANNKAFRSIIEEAITDSHGHPSAVLELASLAVLESRNWDAIIICTYVENAVRAANGGNITEEKDKFITQCRHIEADAYQALHDWRGLKNCLDHLLEMSPNDGRVFQRAGRACIAFGKTEEALLDMVRASKCSPELGPPDLLMAAAWADQGDQTKAREWFEKAAKAEPKSLRVHLAFAEWLVKQNDWANARIHADEAKKLKPDSAEVNRLQLRITNAEKPK
jgi:RNA polymerase sigma factor (sigma-70 family)